MPNDSSGFTLSLFDNTALSGWTQQTASDADHQDHLDPANDDDDDSNTPPPAPTPAARGSTYAHDDDRGLARGWPARARDNITAISLSKALEQSGRAPTPDEQARLLRFVGFGATELAQNCFRRPGEAEFRAGWQEIGAALEVAVTPEEYAALQRTTQYAHYTPETIIRGLWRAADRLGFTGGRVLEPGMGTGLFFALLPAALRQACQLTGIEYDPITARIVRWSVKVQYAAIVNLLLGRMAVPEFIQQDCTPAKLADAIAALLSGPAAAAQHAAFVELRGLLTPPHGTPSQAAAAEVLALLQS